MKLIIKSFGFLIILIGIALIIKPEIIFGFMENYLEYNALYFFAIVFRLGFGILLLIAAKASKHPGLVKFFGYLAIIAAIIFIFLGQNHFQEFVSSLIPSIKLYAFLIGLLAIIIGSFLIYAFSGNKKLNNYS